MDRIDISNERIGQIARSEVLAKGLTYAKESRVFNVTVRRGHLMGEVEGLGREPYQVHVTLAPHHDAWVPETVACSCSAPGVWCAHVVAVVVIARDFPDQVLQRQPLTSLIRLLSLEEAQDVLIRLAAIPSVREQIERILR
ncbi:MAG: hypothetical protein C7B44_04590 [Sulfobacillus thermosulfidooxidans]|nr:MAG: hypothetical protein C7B44_04590 [Sulfobacillus thermosulfidooxidans]